MNNKLTYRTFTGNTIPGSALFHALKLFRRRIAESSTRSRSLHVRAAFFVIILAIVASGNDASSQQQNIKEIAVAWSEPSVESEGIFFSKYVDGVWQVPRLLSTNNSLNFDPSAVIDNTGKVMVVWSQRVKNKVKLVYRRYSDGKWATEIPIPTNLNNNKASTLILDDENNPVIAWTAIEQKYPEIFWSKYTGTWSNPQKVHSTNSVPDIRPRLSRLGDGKIVLTWNTATHDGYRTEARTLQNDRWEKDPYFEARNRINLYSELKDTMKNVSLPPSIKEFRKANIFIQNTTMMWSINGLDF